MIWKPKAGQRVVIRYAAKRAHLFPYHNRQGLVTIVGTGRGPINVMVVLDGEGAVYVPRGNLVLIEDTQKKGTNE